MMTCGVLGPRQKGEKRVWRPFPPRTLSSPLLNPALLRSADCGSHSHSASATLTLRRTPGWEQGFLKLPREFQGAARVKSHWAGPHSAVLADRGTEIQLRKYRKPGHETLLWLMGALPLIMSSL